MLYLLLLGLTVMLVPILNFEWAFVWLFCLAVYFNYKFAKAIHKSEQIKKELK